MEIRREEPTYLEELRCSVRRRSAERVQLTAQGELVTEAKVSDFDVHVSVQQEVLCLKENICKKKNPMLLRNSQNNTKN